MCVRGGGYMNISKTVLEIGIGNGFTSRYLREKGFNLITCDIEKTLKPDIVASVTNLPFPDNSFDIVLACEILEHIPYENALKGIGEIYRVSSAGAVISLPDSTRCAYITFPIPKYGKIQKIITIPNLRPKKHTITKSGHFWEIGKKGFPLKRIKTDIQTSGFVLEKTYRVFENPYHRFFIVNKRS
jgi:ubiquinone/menaquinone biosynthesis C-methylase UbiE